MGTRTPEQAHRRAQLIERIGFLLALIGAALVFWPYGGQLLHIALSCLGILLGLISLAMPMERPGR